MSQQVQITFNIEDESERQAALRALKATDAYLVIWEFTQELRKVWKYSEDDSAAAAAELWRDRLFEYMDQHGVHLDEELK